MSMRIGAVVLCLALTACWRNETVNDPSAWQPPAGEVPRLESVEIRAVGLLAERFRRHTIWTQVQSSGGRKIVSDDPATEERDFNMRMIIEGQREAAALSGALSPSVEGWHTPYIEVWSAKTKSTVRASAAAYDYLHESVRPTGGMHWHRLTKVGHVFSDDPGEMLEAAFRFFEQNPDAPVLILFCAVDGSKRLGGPFDNMTQAEVALLLARPERLAWLRNFAKYTRKADGTTYPEFWKWRRQPPVPFTPTKFFPEPWTVEQFKQFDALPVLATLHRPRRVSYRVDAQGMPVAPDSPAFAKAKPMRDPAKLAAFEAAWNEAMQALGRGDAWKTDAAAGPARILFDHGKPNTGSHLVPATRALMHREEANAARYDLLDPRFGFNTFNILGNMRTAHPMAQWALAAIATHEDKRPSVTLDLRSPDYATITVLTPGRASGATPTR